MGVESSTPSSPSGKKGRTLTIHVEWKTDEHRVERCDHEGNSIA